MDEARKTYAAWPEEIRHLVTGVGIDIGCGQDKITPAAIPFDKDSGDANHILEYVKPGTQYDYVFSSHCLEHMFDPRTAILDWWQLVRPLGALIFTVPDEDLYEQGIFPSIRNGDHKHTFTISKHTSWSDKSINVFDLALSLPDGVIKRLTLQDFGYDRSAIRWASPSSPDQTAGFAMAQIECVVIKQLRHR